MRNYGADYQGFVNPPDSAYPYSSPKNATTDTAEDGTPVEEKWVGDVWGFFQSIAAEAAVTPNGQTESVSNPQILSMLKSIIGKQTTLAENLSGWKDGTSLTIPNISQYKVLFAWYSIDDSVTRGGGDRFSVILPTKVVGHGATGMVSNSRSGGFEGYASAGLSFTSNTEITVTTTESGSSFSASFIGLYGA